MNKYLTVILILFLIYRFNNIEKFEELFLESYSKLHLDNEIRIIIDNVKFIFEKNNYFSSRFKCDQFLLLLDSITEDYNSFLKKKLLFTKYYKIYYTIRSKYYEIRIKSFFTKRIRFCF